MPGPVSDSYHPEFGTGARAGEVRDAIHGVRGTIGEALHVGDELKNILEVVRGDWMGDREATFKERELRIIRYCLDLALESI